MWIESGVLHDFGKAKVGKEDPRRRWGEGPWIIDMGRGEEWYISISISNSISVDIGNDNGNGMSMWYRQTELNHCKLFACVSFSSTVTTAAFDKSF